MLSTHSPEPSYAIAWSTKATREVKEKGRMSFPTYYALQCAGVDAAALERRLLDNKKTGA